MTDIGWKAYPNAKINDPVSTLPTVDDAWMGAAANCSCIAGMASIAWVYPQSISQNISADYSAKFYNPAPTTQPIPQTTNLYQDGNGALKYAKSRTSTEFWPSFYEKAFKKLLTGVYGKDTEPDMTGDWHNISAYAMSRMTGWTDSTNQAIPGTAAGTVRKRHFIVASATSLSDSCFLQVNPGTIMFGFRIMPSSITPCA